jgi:hypothetical protein
MKPYRIFFFLALICFSCSLTLQAQTSSGNTASKLIDRLVGTWKLTKVVNAKKEVDKNSHPEGMTQIEFTREAKFISYKNQVKADSGLFRTNEDHKLIYFEGGIDHKPKEWSVKLQGNMLTLSQKEHPSTRYIYNREATEADKSQKTSTK